METLQNYKVPTGNILIVQGDRGKLELLSLGDYGKAKEAGHILKVRRAFRAGRPRIHRQDAYRQNVREKGLCLFNSGGLQ